MILEKKLLKKDEAEKKDSQLDAQSFFGSQVQNDGLIEPEPMNTSDALALSGGIDWTVWLSLLVLIGGVSLLLFVIFGI